MRVFIFGAGASKDSQGSYVYDSVKSPLSNELFDKRYKDYANIVGLSEPVMNRCRNEINNFSSLEEWVTSEWNKIKQCKEKKTINAQKGFLAQITFYIWLTLIRVSEWTYNNQYQSRETNSYVELMQKLRETDQPFGLINFNYDLLLDFAFKDVCRITLNSIDNYLMNDYIKPHGSVNWLLDRRGTDPLININQENNMDTKMRLATAVSSMYREESIPITGVLIKEPDHRDLYVIDDLLKSFNRQYFYPLIFLPLTTKVYSIVAGFEEKIISKGKELLSRADEIYLIGYKANDEIIKDMCKTIQKNTKLHVIGLNSAHDVMEKVLTYSKNLIKGNMYTQGFHRFVYDVGIYI